MLFNILVSTNVKKEGSNKYAIVSIEFPQEIYYVGDSLRDVTDQIPRLTTLIEAKKNLPN